MIVRLLKYLSKGFGSKTFIGFRFRNRFCSARFRPPVTSSEFEKYNFPKFSLNKLRVLTSNVTRRWKLGGVWVRDRGSCRSSLFSELAATRRARLMARRSARRRFIRTAKATRQIRDASVFARNRVLPSTSWSRIATARRYRDRMGTAFP